MGLFDKIKKLISRKKEVVEEVKEDNELASKNVTELRNMAKEAGIKGYSTMKKDELIASLS